VSATRTETDAMGAIEVPADRYWGAQTARARRFFRFGGQSSLDGTMGERMPREVVRALGVVKRAAATVNEELGLLPSDKAAWIIAAADEVRSGKLDDHFPLPVWQTGSGQQTNMNVNEVIANRAIELAGGVVGSKAPIHPHADVNMSQSSNDAFPTAMHIAAVEAVEGFLLPRVRQLRDTLVQLSRRYDDVVKIGRTHLQDALPLTLGQEISGWASQLDQALAAIESSLGQLRALAAGATTVGTGQHAHPEFARRFADQVSRVTGRAFETAPNKFAAIASHDAFVTAHGALKQLASAFLKLANDVRWLASGPRAGIGEIILPANEPGSSVMPGKVNPTQAEAMAMVCVQVFGNDTTVGFAASQGNFQLNVYKPVIIHAYLQSVRLLGDAAISFDQHCARGIEPDRARIAEHLHRSLSLVTALIPQVGQEAAGELARHAYAHGLTLREAAAALGLMEPDAYDALVQPAQMVAPGLVGGQADSTG
jgi:fumarate hydratase class II